MAAVVGSQPLPSSLPGSLADPAPRERFAPLPSTSAPIRDWQTVVSNLKGDLEMFGLDILAPMAVGWYNEAVPEELGVQIPIQGSAGQNTFAVLVGNTKNIWEPFLKACGYHEELLQNSDPFDTYVERSVEAATSNSLPGLAHRVYWAHKAGADLRSGRHVALQRMAAAIGLAYLDEASHLSLHPKFGPWFSMRCVLVFDDVEYTGSRPAVLPNPMTEATQQYVRLTAQSALNNSCDDLDTLVGNYEDCQASSPPSAGTSPLEPSALAPRASPTSIRRRWQKWVAVRDAPCPGHPWRFPKHMLEYHYTGNQGILHRLIRAAQRTPSGRFHRGVTRNGSFVGSGPADKSILVQRWQTELQQTDHSALSHSL